MTTLCVSASRADFDCRQLIDILILNESIKNVSTSTYDCNTRLYGIAVTQNKVDPL